MRYLVVFRAGFGVKKKDEIGIKKVLVEIQLLKEGFIWLSMLTMLLASKISTLLSLILLISKEHE